jgi:4,5-DOPA dioxygenase extradiol
MKTRPDSQAHAVDHPRRRIVLGSAAAAVSLLGTLSVNARVHAAPAPGRAPLVGRAPALFVGHGSPMNALRDNEFTRALRAWGLRLGTPKAIVMVSAHWLTDGYTAVSIVERPPTIHDFQGFPAALNELQYPAPGHPAYAREAAHRIRQGRVVPSGEWGLDHGAWSVLRHLYPDADVPVFQVSIDYGKSGAHHLAVGRDLAAFRDLGVLVVGSGNLVHNLRVTDSRAADSPQASFAWAQAFDDAARRALDARDAKGLANYAALDSAARVAVPTPDHYWPLLYALGASGDGERAQYVYEGFQAGSISMRCVQFG